MSDPQKCCLTNIYTDVEIFPVINPSIATFVDFPTPDESTLLEAGVLHGRLHHRHRVVLEEINDVHVTNTVMLVGRIVDPLSEECFEVEAFLSE